MNQLKLKRWMERQLWDTREEGPVVKMVVRHLDSNGRAGKTEIWGRTVEHTGDSVNLDEGEIPDIINEMHGAAFDDAEGMAAGLQRYQVLCYVKHKPHAHSRFTFSLSAGNEDVDDTGVTEPNTQKGLLGQLMRHNEALMRSVVMSTSQSQAMLVRTVSSQSDHIEKLLGDRRANFEVMEDLKSQQHDRDLMAMESENKEKRYTAMFEKAQLLLPAVVNRISGKKILPEETTPMENMLKSFAESLTEEQFTGILAKLKPEQQIAMVEFMEASQGKNKQLTDGQEAAKKNGAN